MAAARAGRGCVWWGAVWVVTGLLSMLYNGCCGLRAVSHRHQFSLLHALNRMYSIAQKCSRSRGGLYDMTPECTYGLKINYAQRCFVERS